MPRSTDSAPSEERLPAGGDRIAKLLARAGIASRREIERMIADGRVARDGTVVDTPATVLTSLNGVTVDGNPVAQPEPARLFIYHKPPGLLVTERDPRGRPTIYDRLPNDLPRVVPVGRLDLATEGLLLLTTDGGLKRQLELPATGVERTYRARAYGPISQARLEDLMEGIEIEGVRYGPINANLERRTGANTWIELTLTEGKNREVRRVLEHLGLQVSRLMRIRYGPFILADLPPGEVGEVRQHDLIAFRQTLDGKRAKSAERISIPSPVARGTERPPRVRAGAAPPSRTTRSPDAGRFPAESRGPAATKGRSERSAHTSPVRQKATLRGETKRPAPAKLAGPQPDPGVRRGSEKKGAAPMAAEPRPGFRTAPTTDRAARSAARRKPERPAAPAVARPGKAASGRTASDGAPPRNDRSAPGRGPTKGRGSKPPGQRPTGPGKPRKR
ncbi:pseudouridine synthase [Sphingomonas sp.]|jgi:23S rRNA pseudouridine2605 synthase|uniref:pseudouridine synthase n=1 Tax=Sphingomonas sp. TaxID=28214 RepID=UPI0039C9F09A